MEYQEALIEAKEKLNQLMNDPTYKPMRRSDLKFLLQITDEKEELFDAALNGLIADGKIELSKRGKYMAATSVMIPGTFIANKKGFGFVSVEGESEDFFIPPGDTADAFHGDKVLITPLNRQKTGGRREAKIVRIVERTYSKIVGTYEKQNGFGFVIPDNKKIADDIYVAASDSMGAMTGHKVVCDLTSYGGGGKSPEGKITEILGHINDPKTDILSVVRAYDIPVEYPAEVMKDLDRIPDEVDPADIEGRTDFRSLTTVTIDGEDAKDLDDAITLSKEGDLYTLGVHIADVSHYVTEHSPLDKEALKRGTSCYLIDSVIPMIPHKLSNGICSLNHDVDRLTLSCVMTIDAKGKVVDHTISEGVINVNERMSYTDVQKILDRSDEAVLTRYKDLVSFFDLMKELSGVIRAARVKRGSIDFDMPETKIIVDEQGKPIEINPYPRNTATNIIEDFMLMANETVAEDFFWQEIPFEYRVHEHPDPEKIDSLRFFLNNFGVFTKPSRDEVHPKELQKILSAIEGESYEPLISRMLLRSMKQARYSTECIGHFGLSCKYYCHFTSPIRRYPDLQIHRIIKENLRGTLDSKRLAHYKQILPGVADDNSLKERRAEEAEREVIKLKQIEFMSEHVGEIFPGVVSGLTSNFIFVELENTVEGAISVADMTDDIYVFREEEYAMTGTRTGRRFSLGDRVTIQVAACDKLQKRIDFSLADDMM